MMVAYIRDKKSWILCFFSLLLIVDVLLVLDQGIGLQVDAVIYLNVLLILIFSLFFLWRYKKETQLIRALNRLIETPSADLREVLPITSFLLDQKVRETLIEREVLQQKEMGELRQRTIMESDYLTAWVHEVKAPLTAMKVTIDAHRKEPSIKKIERDWTRVHLLVDEQLYIARLPHLESDYLIEESSPHKMIANEVRELASWCFEKNIAVDITGEVECVLTDRKWCQFILRQLLTNAIKYSPTGATIWIEHHLTPAGIPYIQVRDEGIGIAAHDLPRLFDKGFTGQTGRKQNAATGLGLYLASTIAEKVGCTLQVRSTVGEGATFVLYFTRQNAFDQLRT